MCFPFTEWNFSSRKNRSWIDEIRKLPERGMILEGRNWGYKGKRPTRVGLQFVGGFKALVKLAWVAMATCFTVETTDISRGRIHESRNKFQTCIRGYTRTVHGPPTFTITQTNIFPRADWFTGHLWNAINSIDSTKGKGGGPLETLFAIRWTSRGVTGLKVNPDVCHSFSTFFFPSLHFEKILTSL